MNSEQWTNLAKCIAKCRIRKYIKRNSLSRPCASLRWGEGGDFGLTYETVFNGVFSTGDQPRQQRPNRRLSLKSPVRQNHGPEKSGNSYFWV